MQDFEFCTIRCFTVNVDTILEVFGVLYVCSLLSKENMGC